MFERDVQPILDEYLAGLITEKAFRDSSRPWNNYEKDYRPLVEYARKQKLAVIAANAPRRYVNRVARLGAASLLDIPNPRRRGLPPLPYAAASPAYTAKFNDVMKSHGPKKKDRPDPKSPAPSGPPKMPPADDKKPAPSTHGLEVQSLWDATMAYSIAEFLLREPAPACCTSTAVSTARNAWASPSTCCAIGRARRCWSSLWLLTRTSQRFTSAIWPTPATS